ncbi:hypothetical protein ACHAQH_004275 [Verticillium albo-atrum]
MSSLMFRLVQYLEKAQIINLFGNQTSYKPERVPIVEQWSNPDIRGTDANFVDKRPIGSHPLCHYRKVTTSVRNFQIWVPHSEPEALGQPVWEFCDWLNQHVSDYEACKDTDSRDKATCEKHNGGVLWKRQLAVKCEPKFVESAMKRASVPETPIRCLSDWDIVDAIINTTINGP